VEIGWRLFVLHYYIIEYDNNKVLSNRKKT
jgi:hypothetical protein